ncbi:unnamed protein product [Adineta steineri]|uniref:TASOR pseudo-PARP domain-containing protein n=1 Tax=Adineta steineri TaxID=433720 RepID=A0A814MLU7_9BILA|nr:unnamed protein product [Adineta steineri]
MTDENGTNINGEMDNSSQVPLKMILETSNNSTIERNVYNILRKNFLEQRSITWKPIKVELIVNTQLTDEFFAIRKKFEKAAAGNRCEFDERYAFLIENDTQVLDICQNGYHCTETSFNVLGHSKYGIYVCKYADVCIRHASVRRTWEGNVVIKMIMFKTVEGKQTAALVRKGPKLQPIAPTAQFTSHCSVITPKETDDLEKQFDQSQIFLYEFEGRETIKRPHHCLPYAIISLIQDGSQWPANFEDLDSEPDVLETDTLRVIGQTNDPLLQNKLKENIELAEAATRALEHIYEEEPPPPPPPAPIIEQVSSPKTNSETISTTTTISDTTSTPVMNGTGPSASSPIVSNDDPSTASSPNNGVSINNSEVLVNSTIPPPPPPPPSTSSDSTSPHTVTPATAVATTLPLAHSAAAIQAAYRQTSLLGALPAATAIRTPSGALYATTGGLTNGLTGQVMYGGISLDALRGYQTAAANSQFAFATHAGQNIQQPALYAAQLQAIAQQQQLAAVAAQHQQQQQQQQNLINSIPAGYTLVRTAGGGYALLAQSPAATNAAMQSQAQAQLAQQQQQQQQQQYISFNAAGQPTATTARLPIGMVGGQQQQVVYQYAGQPTIQAGPTQYIQLPANYAQQQGLSTSPVMQTSNSSTQQAYISQPPTHYISASQSANANNSNGSSANSPSVVSSSSVVQSQPTSTIISPQKQSAASATAAAIQQQQQYQHAYHSQQQQAQQQAQQQQSANGVSTNNNLYYTAMAQAQAQAQQQQQLNLLSQMQYSQQGIPQQMFYTTSGGQAIYQAGGQSYILAQAAPASGSATTTGAPVMYSAGPALHNGTAQQHPSQSQQQIAYQIAASGQPAGATYQMINTASNSNVTAQQQSTTGAGVVAQQPAQLVQRSNIIPQVRHHPYRS